MGLCRPADVGWGVSPTWGGGSCQAPLPYRILGDVFGGFQAGFSGSAAAGPELSLHGASALSRWECFMSNCCVHRIFPAFQQLVNGQDPC